MVLPAGRRVWPQSKIDAPGGHERHTQAERGERRQTDGMPRVGVHDLDSATSDLPAQSPHGTRIHLGNWVARDGLQRGINRSPLQRLAIARRDDRNMATPLQLAREPQSLSLAASPAAFRIDVQYSQAHDGQLPRFNGAAQAERVFALGDTAA
jgi:hypothetical protein